ncbi:bifunctional folylpolyglutamate synthase/dihydrofolate synthase [Marinithermofilum abyssi]|uniref:Dihydrofolate synthase/folylpolyglutamate synthase n=1 Tax=Marinithermofilum abyssi TaxID=1571185 RepID=A0A8J2VIT4_9BACL|nr:folylpolyglutamate synthase/dihydrofolate synthase family protein [Marinithermofilum abyssi]GGE18399.1 bifunctional folylpolyglutamate synthase/dihydrofolate synthase [Marinithermofilum abyssi]
MMTKPFTSIQSIMDWMQNGGCARGVKPGLERMEWALARLGNPERRLKVIHIGGTNGKGSTAAMVAAVLQQAGYPVGLFTSPYIMEWNERIQLDGKPIPEEDFIRWAERLRPLMDEMEQEGVGRPTEFEFWTLVAINWFARDAVPWFVVWEVGLGGRFDSTNVVHPLLSVITNVGKDHTQWLGEDIAEIAAEKAGIIKPGVPVVTGCEDEKALSVLRETAQQKNSRLYELSRDFEVQIIAQEAGRQIFHFSNLFRELPHVTIPFTGTHQVKNGAIALMTLELLRQYYATVIEDEDIYAGLMEARWPGRLERIYDNPAVLLDGAHNREGAQALARAVEEFYDYDRLFLLTAVMKDKHVDEILKPLVPLADHVVVTEAGQPRDLEAQALAKSVKSIREDIPVEAVPSPREAFQRLKEATGEKDLILVAGSLFLVSEIRKQVVGKSQESG